MLTTNKLEKVLHYYPKRFLFSENFYIFATSLKQNTMKYTQNKKLIKLCEDDSLDSSDLINYGSKLIRPEYSEGDSFNLMISVKRKVVKETLEKAAKKVRDINSL